MRRHRDALGRDDAAALATLTLAGWSDAAVDALLAAVQRQLGTPPTGPYR